MPVWSPARRRGGETGLLPAGSRPGGQQVLMVAPDGTASEVKDIDLVEVTDKATGRKVLTVEINVNGRRWFGFDRLTNDIDSSNEG